MRQSLERVAVRCGRVAPIALVTWVTVAHAATLYVAAPPCGNDAYGGTLPACAGPNGYKATLQGALSVAQSGDEIVVIPGTYSGPGNTNIAITLNNLRIHKPQFAVGDVVVDGGGAAFIFSISDANSVLVEGVTIRNCVAAHGGAVALLRSTVTFRDCVFESSRATGTQPGDGGGALHGTNSTVLIEHCTFAENSASAAGGALYLLDSAGHFSGCSFRRNNAESQGSSSSGGGAIYLDNSAPAVDTTRFDSNFALAAGGGAVYLIRGSGPAFTECAFYGNHAAGGSSGGAIYSTTCATPSSPTIVHSRFEANVASFAGGALYLTCGAPTISECTLVRNFAVASGGAIVLDGSTGASLAWSEITGNDVSGADQTVGGGLAAVAGAHGLLRSCRVTENRSAYGSGLFADEPNTLLRVENSLIGGNVCADAGAETGAQSGGAVTATNSARVEAVNCTIAGNASDSYGGGAAATNAGAMLLTNTVLSGNSAALGGPEAAVLLPGSGAGSYGALELRYSMLGSGGAGAVFGTMGNTLTLGAGVIEFDALYVSPGICDYRLAWNSPGLDAGDNNAVPADLNLDLGAQPRFVDLPSVADTGTGAGPLVDMGAFERRVLVPADTNCDGAINNFDIEPFVLALVTPESYQAQFPYCELLSGDANRDGRLDNFDIDPFVTCLLGGGCP